VHAAGWMHRDIKLGNAIVGPRGFLTLIDFGLAKHIDAPDRDDPSASLGTLFTESADVTSRGTVLGTPRYLAPEVRAGEPARQASDVYGLGLVLDALLRHVRDGPGPTLASLMDAMTDYNPTARPSAAEVVRELEPQLGEGLVMDPCAAIDGPTWAMGADDGETSRETRQAHHLLRRRP
jgi:eukaryotic-like serine/threonine-protein kinase